MVRQRLLGLSTTGHFIQPPDELGVAHAADCEVEPQQIGVDVRRQRREIVAQHRAAKLRAQRIARQHGLTILLVLRRKLWLLNVEEQLVEPIVSHRVTPHRGWIASSLALLAMTSLIVRWNTDGSLRHCE